jgi:hypothetical protein
MYPANLPPAEKICFKKTAVLPAHSHNQTDWEKPIISPVANNRLQNGWKSMCGIAALPGQKEDFPA